MKSTHHTKYENYNTMKNIYIQNEIKQNTQQIEDEKKKKKEFSPYSLASRLISRSIHFYAIMVIIGVSFFSVNRLHRPRHGPLSLAHWI